MAELGYRVVPLPPNSKASTEKEWQKRATKDPERIKAWFAEYPPNANYGVVLGDGRMVLDVDVRPGTDGRETLARLTAQHGSLPDTFTVDTPSGGFHVYFSVDFDPWTGHPSGEYPGLDWRGSDSYVLGPGSRIDGKVYQERSAYTLAPCPAWAERRRQKSDADTVSRDAAPDFQTDTDLVRQTSAQYLARAPLAVEGRAGDATTYKVAAHLRDLGCSETLALELMLGQWNDRCSPPWLPEDLETKVTNAFKYAQNSPGSKAPEANFDIIPSELDEEYGPEISKRQTSHYGLTWAHEVEPDLEQNWLIEGVLPSSGLAFLVAQSNQGKSFLALDMGMAVALGAPWFGRETERGAVVYLAAEGNLKPRIKAYRLHHKLGDGPIALGLIGNEKECNLFSAGTDLNHLVNAVTSAAKACGQPVRLIVLDTLACVARGADENSGKDMGALFGNCRRLQSATGALVMIVHHLGKDPGRGARGHSSMFAAVDAALQVDNFAVRIEKQRDGKTGDRFGFRLTQVVIGQDRRGRPVESCIVAQDAQALAFERKAPRPDSHADAALKVLRRLAEAEDAPKDGVIAKQDWLDAFCKERFPDDRKRGSEGLIRSIEKLNGWIEQVGDDGFRLVDEGLGGFDGID